MERKGTWRIGGDHGTRDKRMKKGDFKEGR